MKCIKCKSEHDGTFGSGKYCSRSCANSRIFTKESIDKKRIANLSQIPWSKGKKLSWEKTICKCCGLYIEHRKSQPKKYHKECWLKSSGGCRKGSGVGKSGWYNGIWCDSSYELAWVIFNIENGISFERNKIKFSYTWNGKNYNYYPDFIVNEQLIEIKGYVDERTEVKLKSVNNLIILFKKDLVNEFKYVEDKYGKNFIKLYQDKINQCKLCGTQCKNIYCSRKCSALGNKK